MRPLVVPALFAVCFAVQACVPTTEPDDDDNSVDDDDVTGDDDDDDITGDDDDATPGPVELFGQIIALAAESGGVLTQEQYAERAGAIVVYAVTDIADLTAPLAKDTLEGPGSWSMTLDPLLGDVFFVAVADTNADRIIGADDTLRTYAWNPVDVGMNAVPGIDIEIDIAPDPTGGGGGGGGGDDDDCDGCAWTAISGPITLDGLPEREILVGGFAGGAGPIDPHVLPASGPYEISLDDALVLANVGAYHDLDANGLFEPSDPIGAATSNPIQLGVGPVTGVEVIIPSAGSFEVPLPKSAVEVSGEVVYDNYTGGSILVMASYMAPSGQAYDAEILPGPGAFSLDVPASLLDLCVWAVEDADGDGNWDPNLDAMGQWGPDSIGPFGASGITVTLIDPPPAATTISGTVTFDGFTPSVSDTLWIAVAASSDPDVPPTASVPIGGPSNPQTYTVDRVGPGTYYIGALLLPGSGGGGQNPEGFAPPVVVNGVPVSGIDIVVPPVP